MNDSVYRAYAFFLMQNLSQIINDGIGMVVDIYPCSDAVVICFHFSIFVLLETAVCAYMQAIG